MLGLGKAMWVYGKFRVSACSRHMLSTPVGTSLGVSSSAVGHGQQQLVCKASELGMQNASGLFIPAVV